MNAIKIMGAALLLLFVLNLISLAMLLRLNQAQGRPRPIRPAAAAEFLMHELQFNAPQRKYYAQLIAQHRQKTQKLEQHRAELRHNLFAGIAQNDTSSLQALRQVEGEFEWLTFQHFQAVRRLATPEQQVRFDRVIQEVIRRMNPGAPRRHRRHGHE